MNAPENSNIAKTPPFFSNMTWKYLQKKWVDFSISALVWFTTLNTFKKRSFGRQLQWSVHPSWLGNKTGWDTTHLQRDYNKQIYKNSY